MSTATTPPRVLVVDDEPQIVRGLTIILRAAGYTVESAQTKDEALAALESHLGRFPGGPRHAEVLYKKAEATEKAHPGKEARLPGQEVQQEVINLYRRVWAEAPLEAWADRAGDRLEAMAATQGHTQSLHTNALDEALALPTDFSARIARNTQLFLQQESGTNRIIDPWGGSCYVERLTHDLAAKAWGHIQEVEALGGMAKAIEAGVPKLRIEEASAKTQARIDAGKQAVIGVNKYKPVNEAPIDVLKVENSTVRRLQIDKLSRLKKERNQQDVDDALAALTRSAGEGNGNLLALAIDAARAKATVGEISDAMEKVFGRHRAEIKSITGVYKREAATMSNRVEKVQALIDAFEDAEGRRPRILVAKIGQDGHDRGQKVIASAFADVGFDVDIGPLFATAEEAARQAVENDVHILGLSSLAAAHLTAVPELKAALKKHGREDIMIIIGGVVPPQDYDALYKAGAEAIFPPGTVISEAAEELIHKLNARLGHSEAAE